MTCDEDAVNDVPLLGFIENLLFIFDDDCCFDDAFGLVRDSLGELGGEYVELGDGEEDPVVPCTTFSIKQKQTTRLLKNISI